MTLRGQKRKCKRLITTDAFHNFVLEFDYAGMNLKICKVIQR